MAFGDCYGYERQPVLLEPGVYDVYLVWIHEETIEGKRGLVFEFKVKGMSSLPYPGDFVLFDVADPYDRKAVNEFNRMASKIKECFMLYGDFCEANYMAWEMKEGRVYVSADRLGNFTVSDFFPNKRLTDLNRKRL